MPVRKPAKRRRTAQHVDRDGGGDGVLALELLDDAAPVPHPPPLLLPLLDPSRAWPQPPYTAMPPTHCRILTSEQYQEVAR